MKLKFTILMAAFLFSGLMNTFAQIEFTTAEGYTNGELSTQAPTGGMTWTAPETGFLVDATAGTVSIDAAVNGASAIYNQPFSSSESNFSLSLTFSFDRDITPPTANRNIMALRLFDDVNSNFVQVSLIRLTNSTNYRITFFVSGGGVNNSGSFDESELGFAEADASSDDLTLDMSLVKGVDAGSWTVVAKLLNGTTEIRTVSPLAISISEAFHSNTYYYPAFVPGIMSENSNVTNRTVKTFSASPLGPVRYPLTLVAEPDGAGTLTGAGKYEEGASVDITATAADNYEFVKWALEDGTEVSTTANFSYTMPAAASTLKAHFQTTVGVGEFSLENLSLYPNPATDVLNISSSDFTNIEIFNITGKLVKSAQLNGSPVNVSELAKGVYLVRLIGSTTAISKFVKK